MTFTNFVVQSRFCSLLHKFVLSMSHGMVYLRSDTILRSNGRFDAACRVLDEPRVLIKPLEFDQSRIEISSPYGHTLSPCVNTKQSLHIAVSGKFQRSGKNARNLSTNSLVLHRQT
jgi:hypothetical protein